MAGILLFVFANGFETLFAGALVLAIANGMIEAVCNPLTATLYRTARRACSTACTCGSRAASCWAASPATAST